MKKGLVCLGAAFATAASIIPYSQAIAQESAAESPEPVETTVPGDDQASSLQLGEVIVTARRREERLLDVPVTITALDEETITRYASSSIEAVGTLVPQVMFTKNPSGNGANINIRGVGTNTSADDGVEQAVSVNIDEVPTARGRILQTGLFDIEGIQVLKGPQALYFGKNSPGGTIVISSKGPTDVFEGYARAGYEFQAAEYSMEGAFGGPISDTLSFRIAARGSKMEEGYVHNVAGPISAADNPVAYDNAVGLDIPGRAFEWGPNSEQYAVRGTLLWEPTSNFDATLKLFYSDYEDQGDGSQNVVASCTPGTNLAATTDLSNALFTGVPGLAADPYSYCGGDRWQNSVGELPDVLLNNLSFNAGDSAFTKTKNALGSLVMNYDAGDIALTSVTGFYNYDTTGNSFFDTSTLSLAGGAGNSFYQSINQEIRLFTQFDGPFNVTGGLFYSHDRRVYKTWSTIIRGIDPVTGYSNTSAGRSLTEGDTYSAFVEGTWELPADIEIAIGGRYTREEKDAEIANSYVSAAGSAFGLALPVGTTLTPSLSNDNFSPQATISWQPVPNATLYAGYREGFKAGAITNPGLIAASLTNENAVLSPEEVKGFEAGLKFESDDHRLRGDLAVYHFLYDNLQVSAFDSIANTVLTKNAGGSEVTGVDINLTYLVNEALSIRGAVGYNRGRYTTFDNAGPFGGQTPATGCTAQAATPPFACISQNLSGEPLPRAPDWSGTFGATYDAPLTGNLWLGLNADVRGSSKYNFVATANPWAVQDSYFTVDAAVRLHDVDNTWEFAIIGRNLFDEFYFTVGSERPLGQNPGSVMGVPGLPRTVLAQLTYNY